MRIKVVKIATQAAGSRQQSRFLALLSDYSRTQELVSAAYNSAGSASEQFEKTLDSLEAKLNKLSNAWNEFTMGIAQNSLIKGAVDVLTGLLTIINKLTGVFGPTTGAVLKMGLAFVALRAGANFLPKLFKTIATTIVDTGQSAGEGFGQRIVTALTGKTPEVYMRGYTMGQAARQGFEDGARGATISATGTSMGGVGTVPLLSERNEQDSNAGGTSVLSGLSKSQKIAGAVGLAGAGLGLINQTIRTSVDETSELGEALLMTSEALSTTATTASFAAAALSLLGPAAAPAIAPIMAVVGAIGALVAIGKLFDYYSPEKQAERAADSFKKAQEAYDSFVSEKSNYQNRLNELKELTRGTDEWNNKLQEVKASADALREEGFQVVNVNGVPMIDFGSGKNQNRAQELQQNLSKAELDSLRKDIRNQSEVINSQYYRTSSEDKEWLSKYGVHKLYSKTDYYKYDVSDSQKQAQMAQLLGQSTTSDALKSLLSKTVGDLTVEDSEAFGKLLDNPDQIKQLVEDSGLKDVFGSDAESFLRSYLYQMENLGRLTWEEIYKQADIDKQAKYDSNTRSAKKQKFLTTMSDKGYSAGEAQLALNQYTDFASYAPEIGDAFLDAYTAVLEDTSLTKEQKQQLFDKLTGLDITDPNQVKNLRSEIEGIAPAAGDVISAFGSLASIATQLGIAQKRAFDFEGAKNNARDAREAVKDAIESGSNAFSTEDYQKIANAIGGTTEGDQYLKERFAQTESGSYGFIGEVQDLYDYVAEVTDKSYQQNLETLKQQAAVEETANARYREFQKGEQSEKYSTEGLASTWEGLTDDARRQNWLKEQTEAFGITEDALPLLFGTTSFSNLTGDSLSSAFQSFISLLTAGQYGAQLEAATSRDMVSQTPQALLSQTPDTANQEDVARRSATLKAQVYQDENAQNVLKAWNEEASKTTDVMLGLSRETGDTVEHFGKFSAALKNNIDILKKGDKESSDYQKALGEVSKEAKQVFKGIDDDFIQDNLADFEELADGSEEALARIRQNLLKKLQPALEQTENTSKAFQAILDRSATDKEFQITGHMDVSDIFNSVNASEEELQKLKADMNALGFDLTWVQTGTVTGLGGVELPIYSAHVSNSAGMGARNASSGGGGGGGGGGGDKKDVWDNPYDILYNLTEKINEALRDREKLEKTYDRLLEDRNASFSDLIKNTLSTIANLEKEINLQTHLQQGRREQIEKIGRETYRNSDGIEKRYEDLGVMDYARYDFDTQTITIDWEGLEQITDTEKGQAVEDYIGRLEELVEQYEETQDTLSDMEDELREIKERGKSEYLDFEQKVYDAIVARQQLLIDDFSDLASTISDTNSKILDDLSHSIELQRQIRDNTKTEQDLQDKEARLAYLQRDTSGANQTEILQLQKELEEARQNYQDTLIDQELDRLNEVNDVANDQRERQIEIMQAQLDWAAKNGEFWEETYTLIQGAFNEDGTFNNNSALVELLKGTDAFKGMSEFGQMNWIAELIKEYNQAQLGFSDWMVDRESKEGNTLQTNMGELTYSNGKWQDVNGGIYALSYDPKTKSWVAKKADTSEGRPEIKDKVVSNDSGSSGSGGGGGSDSNPNDSGSYWTQYRGSVNGPVAVGRNKAPNAQIARKLEQQSYQQALLDSEAIRKGRGGRKLEGDKSNMKFASGGLTSKTGPAWLDGTLSRPEYVLNPIQTDAFLKLTKVLPSLLSGDVSTKTIAGGDNYYDVNFVVDSIGSDYDVDKLWNRFKEKIYEDSAYRNVHTINRLR